MGFIGILWLISLIIATAKFYKVYGFTNKLLLMFFVCLNFGILFRIIFFFNEFSLKRVGWNNTNKWVYGILTFTSDMFFWSAILFNLFNWWYHILKINQVIYMKVAYFQRFMIIWSLSILQLLNVLVFLAFTSLGWISDNFWNLNRAKNISVSIILLVLSVIFIITGIILHWKLKIVSTSMAKMMKKRIIIAIFLISVPMIVRWIYEISNNFLRFHYNVFVKSTLNNDYRYPIFFFTLNLVFILLPAGLQIVSVQMVINHSSQSMKNISRTFSSNSSNSKYSSRQSMVGSTDYDPSDSINFSE